LKLTGYVNDIHYQDKYIREHALVKLRN